MLGVLRSRWPYVIALLLVLWMITALLVTRMSAQAAPSQPVEFSHRIHVEKGTQCLFCHSSAMRAPVAGIPSVQKCIDCHTIIATESEAVQEIAGYWERGEPVPWERVNRQPDFVFFSHQPHLGAGVSCETCHGDVGQMDIARSVVRMDMGWCLGCHLEQPEEKVAHLMDCLACHK
jgi:hypothetical protein